MLTIGIRVITRVNRPDSGMQRIFDDLRSCDISDVLNRARHDDRYQAGVHAHPTHRWAGGDGLRASRRH
jgi:hypothetical protein